VSLLWAWLSAISLSEDSSASALLGEVWFSYGDYLMESERARARLLFGGRLLVLGGKLEMRHLYHDDDDARETVTDLDILEVKAFAILVGAKERCNLKS